MTSNTIYDSKGNILNYASKRKKPSKKELGSTGRAYAQTFQNHLSTDEYLSTLMFPNDIAIYEKMARSDAQVQALLLMLSLPIRATQWFVVPKDKSSKAKKISEYVEECLFGGYGIGLANGFDDFIKDVTTMFQFGHSIFEKVFEIKKGKVKWKKFAVRPQSTIEDIFYDAVGDCKGINQQVQQENWEEIYIPIEKLLIFSHDMKQGNVRGSSVLRPAYKHWYIKDFLYKIVNVGVERNLVGTPVLTLPENYTQEDKDLADEIVTTLRSSEFGGVRLPAGFLLDMFEGKRTLIDVLPYIEYQDILIARSSLAQSMNLGSGSNAGGSFALSSDQLQLFLMMLDASAKNIANTINTHAIPELVKYNFNSDLFPKLKFKAMNSTKIVNTLKTLLDGKLIVPDDDLEAYIRDMLDLPDMNPVKTRKEIADQFELQQRESLNQTDADKTKGQMKNGDEKSKTPIENNSKQSSYKEKIKDDSVSKKLSEFSLHNISEEMRNELSIIIDKQIIALNEKADKSDINSLATIKVQYKSEVGKIVTKILQETYKLSENDITFKAKSNILGNNISELVKSIFLNCYMDSDNNLTTTEIRQEIIKNL